MQDVETKKIFARGQVLLQVLTNLIKYSISFDLMLCFPVFLFSQCIHERLNPHLEISGLGNINEERAIRKALSAGGELFAGRG